MKILKVIIDFLGRLFGAKNTHSGKEFRSLAWGKKVSPEFRKRVFEISRNLGVDPDHLMACMGFETGGEFSPSVKNKMGSGATGLIQFMPKTAIGLGTTTDKLARMSAVEQLDWVEKYFAPYKGRIKTLEDLYMAILWPAAIGKPNSHVLWERETRPETYRQNAGLDRDKDLKITKAEAASHVRQWLENGLKPKNKWTGTI